MFQKIFHVRRKVKATNILTVIFSANSVISCNTRLRWQEKYQETCTVKDTCFLITICQLDIAYKLTFLAYRQKGDVSECVTEIMLNTRSFRQRKRRVRSREKSTSETQHP